MNIEQSGMPAAFEVSREIDHSSAWQIRPYLAWDSWVDHVETYK